MTDNNPPQFSRDGKKVLFATELGFTVYDVSTARVISHVPVDVQAKFPTSNLGACFDSTASSIYYASGNRIYCIQLDTLESTVLNVDSNDQGFDYFQCSPDGSYLAFHSGSTWTNSNMITIYDIKNKKVKKSWHVQRYGSEGDRAVSSLSFLGNSQVVVNGPTIYDLNGVDVRHKQNSDRPVFVSPDQRSLLVVDDHNDLDGSNDELVCYATSTFGERWRKPLPVADDRRAVFTSDNKAILMLHGVENGSTYVIGLTAAKGEPLPNSFFEPLSRGPNSPFRDNQAYIVASPTENRVLISSVQYPRTASWRVNTISGIGNREGTFCEGNWQAMDRSPIGFRGDSAVVGSSSTVGGDITEIRRSSDGVVLAQLPADSTVSPDGMFFARVDNGVRIYRTSDLKYVTSYLAGLSSDRMALSVDWQSQDQLIVYRKVAAAQLPFALEVVKFADNKLIRVRSYATNGAADAALSPDGTRFAFLSDGVVNVHNVSAGTFISKVPADEGAIVSIRFAIGNRLLVQNYSNTLNIGRVFDVDPKLVLKRRSFLSVGANPNCAATISPDGRYIALAVEGESIGDGRWGGHLRIFRITDGVAVRKVDDSLLGPRLNSLSFSMDGSILAMASQGVVLGITVPPTPTSLAIEPGSVVGGKSVMATVALDHATTTDSIVTLSSSNIATVMVPPSVTIEAGKSSATFEVQTKSVDANMAATISASFGGAAATAAVTVTPPNEIVLALAPADVNGGATAKATVSLNGPAGPSGITVTLLSDQPTVASTPPSVQVPADATTVTFDVRTYEPLANKVVKISATTSTATTTANLVVRRPQITFKLDRTSIKGGNALVATISLGTTAPAGGVSFSLASEKSVLVAPTTVTIPAGKSSVAVGIATLPTLVDVKDCGLTLSDLTGQIKTVYVTVLAPVVKSVTLSANPLVGAGTIYALVQLDGAAPDGFVLDATSSNTAATVPGTVTVPAGRISIDVPILVTTVTVRTVVKIKIGTKEVSLTLLPPS